MGAPRDSLVPKAELGPSVGSCALSVSLRPSTSACRGDISGLCDALPCPDPHLNVVIMTLLLRGLIVVIHSLLLFLAAPTLK